MDDQGHFLAVEPTPLSSPERERIRQLASDIPALWNAPTTTAADRQAIVRQLIERVIVTVMDDSEQVQVEVHWAGGHHTRTHVARPVARMEQLSYYPALLARVVALHREGLNCTEMALRLNAEGWRPAKRRQTFNGPMVANLLARQGLHTGSVNQRPHPVDNGRNPQEWPLSELARMLDMPPVTLFSWIRRGWVQARKVEQAGRNRWLLWADDDEIERLRARRAAPRRWARHIRVDAVASQPLSG